MGKHVSGSQHSLAEGARPNSLSGRLSETRGTCASGALCRLISLTILQVLACLGCTGCLFTDTWAEDKWDYTLLYERRKDELATIEDIKRHLGRVEISSTTNRAVFLAVVGRCGTGPSVPRESVEEEEARRRDFTEYLLEEKRPVVTFIRKRSWCLWGTNVLYTCCNGRMWEAYADFRGLLNSIQERNSDPGLCAIHAERLARDGKIPRSYTLDPLVQEDVARAHLMRLTDEVSLKAWILSRTRTATRKWKYKRHMYLGAVNFAEHMENYYSPGHGILQRDHPFAGEYVRLRSEQIDRLVKAIEETTGLKHGRNWQEWRRALADDETTSGPQE